MEKQTIRKPTRNSFTLLRQLCNLIPTHLVSKLARDTGVAEKSRTFTPWSHVVSLIFAQLTHALGLNGVCDALRLNSGPLSAIRGASGPSKNGFSAPPPTGNVRPSWPKTFFGASSNTCKITTPASAGAGGPSSPSVLNAPSTSWTPRPFN